ncbi:sigma-70 family RNA polymerase sigma factor [Paraburkholderia sp. J8-2]|uniref:sigma-70 family RNA polymerase sigma factor n=1 Tax=Paraburkholderia sp. J8-2 TaxID=2805440 RepID=UPI002AB64905|nr:sigma-70 family RNA polymerase sigma factor [Paraburkholderia sp. J8-2]
MRRVGDLTADELLDQVNADIERVARRCLGWGQGASPSKGRWEELCQEGRIALFQLWDRKSDMPLDDFLRFCWPRIRGAMLDSLREQDHLSRDSRVTAKRIDQAAKEISSTGDRPTPGRIAEKLDMTPSAVHDMIAMVHAESWVHLDDESSFHDLDTLAALSDTVDTLGALLAQERADDLIRAIEELPEREREIVTLRYFHDTPMTEISKRMKISNGRASQIHSQALKRLRESLDPTVRTTSGAARAIS